MPSNGECGREMLAVGHYAADDAERERALGTERVVTGEEHVLRRLGPDHPGKEQRDDAGAELELGLAEDRVARAYGDVAGERHLEGARHARAVDGGDGGLRAVPEAHRGGEVEREDLLPRRGAFGPALHLLLEVEARGEAAAGAAEDDRAHAGVGLERVHRVVD